MFLRSLISTLVLTLLMLTSATAQQSATSATLVQESKEEKEKARQELERKAVALLDATLENAQMLKLPENRALVQATAADLLWPRDEKRARNLFRDAMTSLGYSISAVKDERNQSFYWTLMQLRQQLLQMIARRDAQLALDLLHSTRPEAASAGDDSREPDQELALEQVIADQIAANDPKRALQMAQQSLAKGISYQLIRVLGKLQEKDPESATRLASDVIKKLQTESSPEHVMEAMYLGQELLNMVVRPQGAAVLGGDAAERPARRKPLKLDDETMHDLADSVARLAMTTSRGADPGNLMMLQPLLPEIEKRVPERAAQLRKRMSELNKTLDPRMKEWIGVQSLMRSGTVDELLEAAAKASREMRNTLYMIAAMKLLESGNGERARQVVSDNTTGPEREQMLAQIDQQMMMHALAEGKVDEAKQLASRLRSKTARAAELSRLAAYIFEKGDRKAALQLMNEAQTLVNLHPDSQEEIEALIQLTRAYALIEPPRAFELIEPVIDQANQMLSAAALLEKFSGSAGGGGQKLFRKGEMLMQPGFLAMDRIGAQYIRALAALARADFDHTKALADRFERNEARLMARLLMAQSILSDRSQAGDALNGPVLRGSTLMLY